MSAHQVAEVPHQLRAHIRSLKRANAYDVSRVVHLVEEVPLEQGKTFLVYEYVLDRLASDGGPTVFLRL